MFQLAWWQNHEFFNIIGFLSWRKTDKSRNRSPCDGKSVCPLNTIVKNNNFILTYRCFIKCFRKSIGSKINTWQLCENLLHSRPSTNCLFVTDLWKGFMYLAQFFTTLPEVPQVLVISLFSYTLSASMIIRNTHNRRALLPYWNRQHILKYTNITE